MKTLSCSSERRFGIEIEINAFDGKNRPDDGKRVAGIDQVCDLVGKHTEEGAEVRGYEHTNGNSTWIIKPDSSCGMEICTPILKGWKGVNKVCTVVEALRKDSRIVADSRCSVHLHTDISDLSKEQLAKVIMWWLKIEPIMMDAMPPERKRNRYCQFLGLTPLFQHDEIFSHDDIIKKIGNVKYYTLNTNQYIKNGRKSIEFRIIEGAGARDPYLVKNWTRLILHFMDIALAHPFPVKYEEGNPWSSICWLDTEDTMRFLGFSDNPKKYNLSKGLEQARDWFLARLQKYMNKENDFGPRSFAHQELQAILARFKESGNEITTSKHLSPSDQDLSSALFCESTRY